MSLFNFVCAVTDPTSHTNGFIFVRIQGGFHEIRNSVRLFWYPFHSFFLHYISIVFVHLFFLITQIADVVVVARLLNATLVIPEILSTTSSKGIRFAFYDFIFYFFHSAPFIVVDLQKSSLIFCFCCLWSSEFKSFAYLYDEDQFMAALVKDVVVVKALSKQLKEERRKKNIPAFKVPFAASPYYYQHRVLPILKKHSVV